MGSYVPHSFVNEGTGISEWAVTSENVHDNYSEAHLSADGETSHELVATSFEIETQLFTSVTLAFGRAADIRSLKTNNNSIQTIELCLTVDGNPIPSTNQVFVSHDIWEKYNSTRPRGYTHSYTWYADDELSGVDIADSSFGVRIQVQHSGSGLNTAYLWDISLAVN